MSRMLRLTMLPKKSNLDLSLTMNIRTTRCLLNGDKTTGMFHVIRYSLGSIMAGLKLGSQLDPSLRPFRFHSWHKHRVVEMFQLAGMYVPSGLNHFVTWLNSS
ncbi:BA75_04275T0 [Komagataella pastoris]|uniref:BA75_04275T0 n=1 Tax=Komagataella pastoris TaxID=4922 RepID=A0A1B2JEU0_PICPA|nr:BA75_04275T0 [Komagataella pastoris]